MALSKDKVQQLQKEHPFMSLSEIMYKILLQEIATFQLLPNTKISENSLSQQLEVSRSPVKAALEQLEKKGFVIKNRGYTVANFSQKEYNDIMDLAMLLEPYAAGQAALRITDKELDTLCNVAIQMRDLYNKAARLQSNMDCDELIDLEYQFHTGIIIYAKNPLLKNLYYELRYKLLRYRNYLIYDPPEGIYETLGKDHCLIVDAIRLRDKGVAIAMMRRHLCVSQRVFRNKIKFKSILK